MYNMFRVIVANCCCRRKEITMERKKAAEERRRLEEEKAKVSPGPCFPVGISLTYPGFRWVRGKLPGCVGKLAGQRRSTTDSPCLPPSCLASSRLAFWYYWYLFPTPFDVVYFNLYCSVGMPHVPRSTPTNKACYIPPGFLDA